MSRTHADSMQDSDGDPRVPTEVLDAIESLSEGETASKEEIESVLEF